MKKELQDIYEYIDDNFEGYVEEIRNYLRTTGISYTKEGTVPALSRTAQGEGIEETAEATAEYIRAIGGESKLCPLKGGNPVVYGTLKSKNSKAKTLLLYSHYDVVGVNPEAWTFPPFAAEMVDAEKINLPKEMGKVIVARGAHDKKGVDLAFILTLKAIKEVRGDIPVNVIFALEGAEEIGSAHFEQFTDEYYEELNQADACYACGSYRQFPSGLLVIHPGYNGKTSIDLEIKAGEWGGRMGGKDVWSGYTTFVDQPLVRLAHAISTMISRDGEVLIEGFYDNWIPPTPEDKVALQKSKERLGDTTLMQDIGPVKRFRKDLSAEELFEDFLTAPQVGFISIVSEGKELIPMKATARLHCRFGPKLSAEEILQKIRKHLDKCEFPEIDVHYVTNTEWARSPTSEDVVQALIRMAEIHGVEYVVWPTSPATDAFYLLNGPPLNKPLVCGSLGHGGRFHNVDEYITVEGMRDNMKGTVTFLYEYAST